MNLFTIVHEIVGQLGPYISQTWSLIGSH